VVDDMVKHDSLGLNLFVLLGVGCPVWAIAAALGYLVREYLAMCLGRTASGRE
jgi:hypothetical protein